jgi:hypothetical protein
MTAKKSPNRITLQLLEHSIFSISKCIQRSKQKLYIYFSLSQGSLLKNRLLRYQKVLILFNKPYSSHVGCAVFAAFFIRFEANIDLIRFIFACFGIFANTIYSHHSLHIRFNIFAQICMQIFIFSYWRIFASKYSLWSEYSQNCKRISHTSEYSLENIRILANIRLYLLRTEYSGAP